MPRPRALLLLALLGPVLTAPALRADTPPGPGASASADAPDEPPPPPALPDEPSDPGADDDTSWCAPGLDTLADHVCAHVPATFAPGPRTLVIFLHGVIKPGLGWQRNQQLAARRVAATAGVAALMPRGRRGVGPKGMEDWYTWPARPAHASIEAEVIAEWTHAKEALEARLGQPFERVWVFGFSNGAYYATSLALQGRLTAPPLRVDGFAVFAGGSAAPYIEKAARHTSTRRPLFVGWGGRDPDHRNQQRLASMLRRLRWPSASEGAPKAGHVMTDHAAASAVKFLRTVKKP